MTASGSFTGSFAGEGGAITGITADSASDIAFDDVRDKPSLFSASIQVDHDATFNFEGTEHFLQSAITEVGTVVTGDVDAILPVGTLSASAQITGQLDVTGVSGSFTGSHIGEGSALINVSASDVAFDDVRDKPTLFSASIQVDHDAATNFAANEHFLQSAITEVGTVVTGDVDAILPVGTLSSSAQITGQLDVTGVSGSFTGSFAGDGTGITGITADSASDVAFDDVRDKPTLFSASIQVDHDATLNFVGGEHFLQSAIIEVGTVVTGDVDAILPGGSVSASIQVDHDATLNFVGGEHFLQSAITEVGTVVTGDVDAILPTGIFSSSAQITGQLDVTGITGSLQGTASWADNVISASYAVTASFALNGGGGGDYLPLAGGTLTGDLVMANAATFSIQDAGGTDSASFSHDGTDFNLTFANTSEYNMTGFTRLKVSGDIYIKNGRVLRVQDAGNTDFGTWSHDGTDFNLNLTNTVDYNIVGFTGGVVINLEANNNSILTIGESSTLRGDSQRARIHLQAENGGSISSGQIINTGTSLQIQHSTGAVRFQSTVHIRTGNSLIVQDAADAVSGKWVHDGTDFSLDFIATTDYNITNLSGSLKIDGTSVSLDGHTHLVSEVTDFDPADYLPLSGGTLTGNLTAENIYVADDVSQVRVGTGGDGRFYHNGSHTYVYNKVGNLRIYVAENGALGDGIQFYTSDTLRATIFNDGTYTWVGGTWSSTANVRTNNSTGFSVGTNYEMRMYSNTSSYLYTTLGSLIMFNAHASGVISSYTNSVLRHQITNLGTIAKTGYIDVTDGTGATGGYRINNKIILSTQDAYTSLYDPTGVKKGIQINATSVFLNGDTIFFRASDAAHRYQMDGDFFGPQGTDPSLDLGRIDAPWQNIFSSGILSIANAGETDSGSFSHDGTDFNLIFNNTTDWNITDLPNIKVNRRAASTTAIHVGEPSVARGDSQHGSLILYGENASGDIGSFSITHGGSNVSVGFGGATTPALQLNINVDVLGDKWLQVRDGTNADRGRWTHDGTDFNLDCTNTTKYNIVGAILNIASEQIDFNDSKVLSGDATYNYLSDPNAGTKIWLGLTTLHYNADIHYFRSAGSVNRWQITSTDLRPGAADTYDLGTSGYTVRTGYFGTDVKVGGTSVSLVGHTHSYLPLTGGTLTGNLTIDNSSFAALTLDGNAADAFISYKDAGTDKYKVGYDQSDNAWKINQGANFTGFDFKMDVAGAVTMSNSLILQSETRIIYSAPKLRWTETGAAANNGEWDMVVASEQFRFRILNDAGGSVNIFTVDRTTTTVDSVNFPVGLKSGGTAVSILGHTHTYLPLTGGTLTGNLVAPVIIAEANDPYIRIYESDANTDEGKWDIRSSAGQFQIRAINDAYSIGNIALAVNRTAEVVTSVQMPYGYLNIEDESQGTGGLRLAGKIILSSNSYTQLYDPTGVRKLIQGVLNTTYFNNNTMYFRASDGTHRFTMDGTKFGPQGTTAGLDLGSSTDPWEDLFVSRHIRMLDGGTLMSQATGGGTLFAPGGANYYGSNSVETGSIKIALPVDGSSDMISFQVTVFDYAVNESFTVFIHGYTYQTGGGNTWTNETAYIVQPPASTKNFTVRFGHDGTNQCVYIGELNSSWSYPQIQVHNLQVGYTATSVNYATGWRVEFEDTAFEGLEATYSNIVVGSYQGTPLTTSGDILYYNSGEQRLAKGSDDEVLTLVSGIPAWAAAGSGISNTISTSAPSGGGSTGDIWCRV